MIYAYQELQRFDPNQPLEVYVPLAGLYDLRIVSQIAHWPSSLYDCNSFSEPATNSSSQHESSTFFDYMSDVSC